VVFHKYEKNYITIPSELTTSVQSLRPASMLRAAQCKRAVAEKSRIAVIDLK